MKSVFFGSSEYVLPIVKLLGDKFGLSLIVTTEKSGPVIEFSKQVNIPHLSIQSLSQNTKYKIQNTKADIGVVADFGLIIPKHTINLFPRGVLNVHPSLLPKYRGPTPVQTAVLNGDEEAGITIIKLDERVDHGPILAQEEFEIEKDQTAQDLLKILFKLGAGLLEKTLIDYIEEVIQPIPQDDRETTITKLLSKQDGFIDLDKPPSKDKLDRMIRAFYPWPGVWFRTGINGKQAVIKFLPQQKIQVEGKNLMSYKDFINGYKEGAQIVKQLGLT